VSVARRIAGERGEQLPDLLAPGLTLVFVGSQAGGCSAKAGAYYAGRGNRFWKTLFEIGLTPRAFAPLDYREMLSLGFGFTDLVKVAGEKEREVKPSAEDLARFDSKLECFAPKAIAFTSKGAAVSYLRASAGAIGYGRQPAAPDRPAFMPTIFVLPSPSGAARKSWDLAPWRAMAEWASQAAAG
jgi:double-stranded uracil-DNA glycosylase